MDGVGGCIKNFVFRAVLSGKIVISTPRQFCAYAQQNIKGINCIYQAKEDVLVEPNDVAMTPYVPAMRALQVHMVQRVVKEV